MPMDFSPVGGSSGVRLTTVSPASAAASLPSVSMSLRPAATLDLAGASVPSVASPGGSRLSLNLGATIRNWFAAPEVKTPATTEPTTAPAAPGLDSPTDLAAKTTEIMPAPKTLQERLAYTDSLARDLPREDRVFYDMARNNVLSAYQLEQSMDDAGKTLRTSELSMQALESQTADLVKDTANARQAYGLRLNAVQGDQDAALLIGAKTTGKYWGTEFSADPATMEQVNRSLNQRAQFVDLAQESAASGNYSEARGYLQSAQSALDAAVTAKNMAGRIEHRTGFMGMMVESADGVTTQRHFDWESLAALSTIVLPILSTVYTTQMTLKSNKMQMDWQQKENDKDRQNALDQLRLQGQYQIEAAQIAADAEVASSSHPSVGASSVPSLGGSFSG